LIRFFILYVTACHYCRKISPESPWCCFSFWWNKKRISLVYN